MSEQDSARPQPLQGLTLLDCSQVVSGNRVGMMLADFGADVIKVEHPVAGDALRAFGNSAQGVPLYFTLLARNKKSINLALNKARGQELFRELVETMKPDVVLESFRPGTLEKWGLGYDVLSKIHPELILVRISGYGQTGPYRERPGFGTLAEAMSGFADMNGYADGPPTLPPLALADGVAALYAVSGILMALRARDSPGGDVSGQVIDISLLESLFSLLGNTFLEYEQLGILPQRRGSRAVSSAPRNVYLTSDDRWIAIAGSTQRVAERLFHLMGRPELVTDPRFASNRARVQNVDELDRIVGDWVRGRSQEAVLDELVSAEVAAAPVADMSDLATDPHLEERDALVTVAHPVLGDIRMPGVLPRLTRTPGEVRHGGPEQGSANDEIFRGVLGLSAEEIDDLRARQVI